MVFEELLVNALVHRDCHISDSVKLFFFDDQIEIISPGCLPNSLTGEEALRGIGRYRKPHLLSLADELMNYRGSRSGLKRVRSKLPNVSVTNDIEAEEAWQPFLFRSFKMLRRPISSNHLNWSHQFELGLPSRGIEVEGSTIVRASIAPPRPTAP